MKIVKQEGNKHATLNTQEVSLKNLFRFNSTVLHILESLKGRELYPIEIAERLKVHEQNIYYYVRKLEKAGIIKIAHRKKINGVMANVYALSSDSFFFKLGEFHESAKIGEKVSEYLSPFIEHAMLNALIIVGSPDPHGPQKARSKDGYFGMDLALFLGTFVDHIPESQVRLDTEVREEDLKENNLIVLGGHIVNKVASLINKKMPIQFDEREKGIISTISGKTYHSDETGFINKVKSPFNKQKEVLFIAGNRNAGTKAAILAFLRHFKALKSGNYFNKEIHCRVVEGIDLDSDGFIDDVEFLE